MAFMKFNRFTECESGATVLTGWLRLPHLEQQLIKLKLNTGAMFTELFSRTMVGQTKLPRKYRYTKRMKAKHKQMEADMKETKENTVKTVCGNCQDEPTRQDPVTILECGHVLCAYCSKDGCMLCTQPIPDNEFSEQFTGDFKVTEDKFESIGEEILELVRIDETTNGKSV